MNVTINPSLGVHACSNCAWTLSDGDFLLCGIQFKPEVAMCFEYRCPKCKFHGRWTVGLLSEDRLAAALELLKEIVREELPAKPRRTPVFRNRGNRLSDLFNSSDV